MINNVGYKDGKLCNNKGIVPNGKYIFVLLTDNSITLGHIELDTHRKLSKIEKTGKNDIVYCGELSINDGVLGYFNNKSGTYRPKAEGKGFNTACNILGDKFESYEMHLENDTTNNLKIINAKNKHTKRYYIIGEEPENSKTPKPYGKKKGKGRG